MNKKMYVYDVSKNRFFEFSPSFKLTNFLHHNSMFSFILKFII